MCTKNSSFYMLPWCYLDLRLLFALDFVALFRSGPLVVRTLRLPRENFYFLLSNVSFCVQDIAMDKVKVCLCSVIIIDDEKELLQKAKTCLDKDDYITAISLYSQILSLDAKNVKALRHRGECYRMFGKINKH